MEITLNNTCKICSKEVPRPLNEYDTYAMAQTCSKVCYEKFVGQSETGLRLDEGKSRVDLIPAEVLMSLGDLYREGAKKYSDDNWRKGIPYKRMYGSLLRHLLKWWAGSEIDEETGVHHLDAVIWGAVGLRYFEMYPELYKQFDDRFIVTPDDTDTFVETEDGFEYTGPIVKRLSDSKYHIKNVPLRKDGLYETLWDDDTVSVAHLLLTGDSYGSISVSPVPVAMVGKRYPPWDTDALGSVIVKYTKEIQNDDEK